MHLSALSDGFLSDSIRDSAPITMHGERPDGASHAAGLLRGLAFAAALTCPIALAAIPSWLHHCAADAGFAEFMGQAPHVGP